MSACSHCSEHQDHSMHTVTCISSTVEPAAWREVEVSGSGCRLDYAVNTVGYERMTAALQAIEKPETAVATASAARPAGSPPAAGLVLRAWLLAPMIRPDTFPVRLQCHLQ